jgi:energy-coupling factor transporter ATP-binding protein EcfA2
MNKIKNLSIKGLRGIKKEINFPLNGKSILLYGENGSGKSSVTDALEWFYYDKIEHLSSEEIGRKGLEGLRNIHIADSEDGFISIEYSDSKLNSSKVISQTDSKFTTSQTNNSNEFLSFLDESKKEQIILRYRDLVSFILATKSEKLTALSEIIGFSEVIKTRDALRKSFSALKREIKNSNFDSQISYQQEQLITQLEQNVVSDVQYIDTVNNLLKPIQIVRKATTFNDLDGILELIKKPEDTQIVEQQLFLEKVKCSANQLMSNIENIENHYKNYYTQYQNIISDIEKLNKIKLESLLSEGVKILKEEIIKDEVCPLCLQPKNKLELLKELQDRLEELQKYQDEKSNLDYLKSDFQSEITKTENIISNILTDSKIETEDNTTIKSFFSKAAEGLDVYKAETKIDVLTGNKLKTSKELLIDKKILQEVETFSFDKINKLKESRKGDEKFDIHSKIVLSKNAYLDIKRLKKSKELLEKQQYTLEKINAAFIKKMEEGFTTFLNHLSKDINDLYVFMNPGEHIEDINLVPIQKNDEFSGITIQFKFFENYESPPNKYLSESHLNCLGIAFYLTSVKAFNKTNKLFILDDVISSFDTNHRARFAHLLTEKFSDYQIILMTHEKDWFDYISKIVKGENWLINTFKLTDKEELTIDLPLPSLKKQIENKISQNDIDGLGNKIRKYLEGLLKEMAKKLGVYMRFEYNDKNENRMPNELLTSLKSHLNKHTNVTIDSNLIDRLISTVFIGNKDSHDSSYKVSFGDCKAFWADVTELEKQYRNYIN